MSEAMGGGSNSGTGFDVGASGAYLGEEWHTTGATFEVTSPATGEVVGTVADCGAAEAERAAGVASEAFASWRKTTAFERAALLERWASLLLEQRDELAAVMTAEMGKPI